MDYFGPIYEKSVLEAMGSTGIIAPDYRKSLDRLRDRLGLSEADAQQLYLAAVEEKMKPMVEWIVGEMERTMLTQQQLSRRRKKDMGEDLFQTGKGADVSASQDLRMVTLCDLEIRIAHTLITSECHRVCWESVLK